MKNKLSDSSESVSLANELNDTLAAITGFAELAAANRQVCGDAKLALYIDEIRKRGLHGSELLLHWVSHVHAGDSAAGHERAKP